MILDVYKIKTIFANINCVPAKIKKLKKQTVNTSPEITDHTRKSSKRTKKPQHQNPKTVMENNEIIENNVFENDYHFFPYDGTFPEHLETHPDINAYHIQPDHHDDSYLGSDTCVVNEDHYTPFFCLLLKPKFRSKYCFNLKKLK